MVVKAAESAPHEQLQQGSPSLLHSVDAFDKSFSAWLYADGRSHLRGFLKFLEMSGTGSIWIPAIIALWLAPFDYPSALRALAFNLLVGFLLDLALIGSIKGLARRTRPKYNREFSVLVPVDVYSFPSGHASRAIFIASFLCFCIYANKGSFLTGTSAASACSLVAFWAACTASSRVFLGRHYFLDVVAGCLLGILELVIMTTFLWVSETTSTKYHSLLWQRLKLLN
ncbi:lipid phosphate phosphatase [Klebsormidium nitens]|uniref:Lipid phosphate phosphatase n=1 Tax=Klebsormidium nitens TaxID=105231 RepID=A0A1Y1IDB8_KLENI|nr:lipid phosphate phosphatase [Klebsormidium nitens]|eukprot:GAQ87429.1 lipid phosphate phosphatase [Klebsormidium nitens]